MVAGLLLLTWLVTRRTAIGMFIESVGINPTAARFAGINAKNILLGVYTFSGFCAGLSGLVVCSTVMSADGNNAGNLFELDAILAVVLGGTSLNGGKFYLLGSMIGALIIQTLTTTIYAFNVAPEISQVVKAFVVYGVSLLQSETFRRRLASLFVRRGAVGMTRRLLNSKNLSILVILALFVIMFGYGSFAYTGFFSVQNFLEPLHRQRLSADHRAWG